MGIMEWASASSPWVLHYNSGGCNGCDIEVVAALMPRCDVERLGIKLEGSPRHADMFLVQWPVTLQQKERLKRVYDQMPEPRYVIAIGQCACSGAVFKDCYSHMGGVDNVIPVDAYIPGCPPKPEAIIDGIAKVIKKMRKGTKDANGK
jgi:NADH-quinone oxidoreductase B subunit